MSDIQMLFRKVIYCLGMTAVFAGHAYSQVTASSIAPFSSEAPGPQKLTLTNTGTSTVVITEGALTGSNFRLSGDTCNGKTLAAKGTCEITVSFSPNTTDTVTQELDIFLKPGATIPISLSGTGTPASSTKPTTQLPAGISLAVGVGAQVTSRSITDYNNDANVLQSTHLGAATPQYFAGVAFQLPWNIYGKHSHCSADAKPSYNCQPLSAIVSAKFVPGASNTINGITFGLTHHLMANPVSLDLMIGWALTPVDVPSIGFRTVAAQTVVTQKAAGNTFYDNFDPVQMLQNSPNAFDGFPTELVNSSGSVTGQQIYPGNPLVTSYTNGFIFGVSLPLSVGKLLGGS